MALRCRLLRHVMLRIGALWPMSLASLTRGLVLSVMFSSSALSAGEKPVLKLVSPSDPPNVFSTGNEESGLVVRYVDELMARSGFEYELEILPLKRALLKAYSTVDTCVFPVERSQEREAKLTWISPISISRYGLFQRPDRNLESIRVLNDAKDLRIGSYLGSAVGEYLKSWDFYVDEIAENDGNVVKLMAGRIDVWASDLLSARFIAAQKGYELDEPDIVFFTTLRAIGCHPSLSLSWVNLLNEDLHKMYKDGTIEKINRQFEAKMKMKLD